MAMITIISYRQERGQSLKTMGGWLLALLGVVPITQNAPLLPRQTALLTLNLPFATFLIFSWPTIYKSRCESNPCVHQQTIGLRRYEMEFPLWFSRL